MSLQQDYIKTILPAVQKETGAKNIFATPRVTKVVVNIGIGSFVGSGNKDFSTIKGQLALIAGQAPIVSYSKKSISNFKLRENMPVGLKVTLRNERMFEFLEKLVHVVIPRLRDFQGLSIKSFDEKGNYNIGFREHTVFPEVVQDDVVKTHGIQVTIKTTAKNPQEGKVLLSHIWFPFKK